MIKILIKGNHVQYDLLGHCYEILAESGVILDFSPEKIPLLGDVYDLLGIGCIPYVKLIICNVSSDNLIINNYVAL